MGIRSAVSSAVGATDTVARRVTDRVRAFPPGLLDAIIAAAVTIASVGPAMVDGASWWIVGLSVLASAPVLWRRRAPIAVLLVVGPAITVLACLHAMPTLPYGTIVCAYTIAAYSPTGLRRGALVGVSVGVLFSLVVPNESPDSYGYAAMSFATAWALGTGVRARRAQIEMLQERARRLDEERVAAVDRERLRIARDMHDIVAHSVGLMIVQAETGPLLTRVDPARADATFAGIAETGREAVQQLRHSLGALRGQAVDLPHQPGIDAIADLVEMSRHSGLAASFEEYGPRRSVSGEVAVTAYRVVQEALTNTRKHAHATCVRVSLRWSEDRLTVRVSDDGRGDADTDGPSGNGPGTNGHGLLGMRERVGGTGGRLHYGPSSSGFDVAAELPIAQES
ncbi:sensor histidine kinase [Nocardia sp. NBC_01009]|uniref:sensor histidine kinase n=1 Tax=Nocardia sp. NBC_01009 TaxID=2975996 RepID=UPI003866D18A|nr:sensor histidine kinase [Nocardia sp. NBC_01009]